MLNTEEVIRRWDALDAELKAQFGKSGASIEELGARLMEIEQKMARRPGVGGADLPQTAGRLVTSSDKFKSCGGSSFRGRMGIEIATKSITSAVGSGGAFVPADHRPEPVLLPRRRLTVRDLVAPGNTQANSVEYPRQTIRTNNAAAVAEGAVKPESVYEFELVNTPVRTLAHWVPASKQVLDDSSLLAATIDSELRYGLQLEEENQLLHGDGTGVNLHGIVPQATNYSPTISPSAYPTRFDTLLAAIAQVELALFPATGIVVNDQDLRGMQMIKDNEGRYVGGGPFGPPITSIWGVPAVGTPEMAEDNFLVGAFRDASQVFDRETAVVEISTEHSDFFTRNLVAIRGEQRLAFAVKRPSAFVAGSFGDVSG